MSAFREIAKKAISAAPALRPIAARLDYMLTGQKNLLYDERTIAIMRRVLKRDSIVVDVGTHEAELLRCAIRLCPLGPHYAFEALPELAAVLRSQLPDTVIVHQVALHDKDGPVDFFRNRTVSGRSGLRRTPYDQEHDVEPITVPGGRLDDLLPSDTRVDLIKVDVEGAELLVFRGAVATLKRFHPLVIFEHGAGGADESYGNTPEEVFDLLSGLGYLLFTLAGFLHKEHALSRGEFGRLFHNGEYYFVASVSAPN